MAYQIPRQAHRTSAHRHIQCTVYVLLFYTTERIIFLLVVYGNSSQGLQTFASVAQHRPAARLQTVAILNFLIFLLLCSTTSTHRRSRGVGARDSAYAGRGTGTCCMSCLRKMWQHFSIFPQLIHQEGERGTTTSTGER